MKQTYLLSALCVLFSLFSWLTGKEAALTRLGFNLTNFIGGKFWTILTSLFVHWTLFHLVSNLIFLLIFGLTLEDEIGPGRTLTIFLVGGVVSSLVSAFFYPPETYSIGASGAIFSLAAAVMLIKPFKGSGILVIPIGLVALIYFFYNLLAILYGEPGNISYESHIIGFTVGAAFGVSWSEKWAKNMIVTVILFLAYVLISTFLMDFIQTLP
mgnify:CR=1 FL=1